MKTAITELEKVQKRMAEMEEKRGRGWRRQSYNEKERGGRDEKCYSTI